MGFLSVACQKRRIAGRTEPLLDHPQSNRVVFGHQNRRATGLGAGQLPEQSLQQNFFGHGLHQALRRAHGQNPALVVHDGNDDYRNVGGNGVGFQF